MAARAASPGYRKCQGLTKLAVCTASLERQVRGTPPKKQNPRLRLQWTSCPDNEAVINFLASLAHAVLSMQVHKKIVVSSTRPLQPGPEPDPEPEDRASPEQGYHHNSGAQQQQSQQQQCQSSGASSSFTPLVPSRDRSFLRAKTNQQASLCRCRTP